MKPILKKKIIRRLRITEGQVRGLQRLVEDHAYCIDVIRQSSAVREALSGIEDLLLENHLGTHVVEQMKSGKSHTAIKEVLAVYKLSKHK